jgi:hypothetical protein
MVSQARLAKYMRTQRTYEILLRESVFTQLAWLPTVRRDSLLLRRLGSNLVFAMDVFSYAASKHGSQCPDESVTKWFCSSLLLSLKLLHEFSRHFLILCGHHGLSRCERSLSSNMLNLLGSHLHVADRAANSYSQKVNGMYMTSQTSLTEKMITVWSQ